MTPEERTEAEAWARWAAKQDDGSCVSAGGLYVKLQKFPPPDTSGMSPDEANAAVVKWQEAIAQWEREGQDQPLIPRTAPAVPADPHPEAARDALNELAK